MEDLKQRVRKEILQLKPYIPGKHMEELKRELGINEIIKLASNENPLGPSKRSIEAMKRAAETAHIYPDSYNYHLKKALAEKYNLREKQLILGNGSDELIKLIAETFLAEGDEIIMPDPSFSEYEFASTLMGAQCIKVPTKDFRVDVNAIRAKIGPRTKLVFLCNPNNPTGTIVTRKEMDEFIDCLPGGTILVLDEAYCEYVTSDDYPDGIEYIRQGKDVIVLRTFSKVYGLAGLRIGYGISSEEIIDMIQRVKEPFNVNSIAQAGALESLKDEIQITRSREMVEKGKKYLYHALTHMGLTYVPTEANFLLINVNRDSQEVFQELLKRGVIIRTGDIFDLPDYIRVTIGTMEQNERFISALKEVLLKLTNSAQKRASS